MRFLRRVILGCYSAMVCQMVFSQSIQLTGASKIESRYRFENDTSLLNLLQRWTIISRYEMTFTGRNELPLVPELKGIQALTFRDAIEQSMASYKNYNFDVVMHARIDEEKKHLYLSSAIANDQEKLTQSTAKAETGFVVRETDKSLVQVLVRWATQAGYQAAINEQLVNLDAFPRHPTRYADYSLVDSAKKFRTQSPFKEAVSQFLILYSGRSLTPFTVSVDESTKRMSVISLVK